MAKEKPAGGGGETTSSPFNFGVTKDTKSKNKIPFLAPREELNGKFWFPKGTLTAVKVEKQKLKDESEQDVLAFYFVDETGDREHRHIEWTIEHSDEKASTKFEGLNSRIAHIHREFMDIPEEGLGKNAKNFVDYFEKVADAFNNGRGKGKPIYKTAEGQPIKVWIKLTYYNNNLNFPLSPNFIEKVVPNKETTLTVNLAYDKIKQDATAKSKGGVPGAPGGGAGGGSDEFPTGF